VIAAALALNAEPVSGCPGNERQRGIPTTETE
jgi:hypothetical protein